MEQTCIVADEKWHRRAGALRCILIPMMVAVIFVTITAIVRPASHPAPYEAQSIAMELTGDDAAPLDQPQIGLAGEDLNHIPATLVGADFNHIELPGSAPMRATPTYVFRYQHATWLKGFEPPP